jgi:hypothetical protein
VISHHEHHEGRLKNAPGQKYDRNAMTWTVENAPATTGTPATPSPQPSAR